MAEYNYDFNTYVRRKLFSYLDSDNWECINYKLGQFLNSEECPELDEKVEATLREMLGEDYERLHQARMYVSGLMDGLGVISSAGKFDLAELGIIEREYGV